MSRPTTRPPSVEILDPLAAAGATVRDLDRKLDELEGYSGLPRVAIVGDASSGKTSLLEALSGLTLPTDYRPSTRFAVQVRSTHTTDVVSSVQAYIIPGPSDSEFETAREHLEKFNVYYQWNYFNEEALVDLLEDAGRHMELYDPFEVEDSDEDQEAEGRFSDNILAIELSGPEFRNFTVVDLPGLMHSTTGGHSDQDISMVQDLIMGYLGDPRTIILAVADATNNINNQEVFELAKTADPQGLRTIGVLTKCDAIQPGDEKRVMRIAQNKVEHLSHGWFVVKNRSPLQLEQGASIEQRNISEKAFFSVNPWIRLDYHRVGIDSLKAFIGDMITNIMHNDITGLLEKIQNLADETHSRLPTQGSSSFEEKSPEFGNVQWATKWDTNPSSSITDFAEVSEKTVTFNEQVLEKVMTNADIERGDVQQRPTILVNATVVGLTLALCLLLVGLGCRQIVQEITTDGTYYRLLLLLTSPLQMFVSLFFCQSLINSLCQLFGPVSQMRSNSKFFSAVPAPLLKIADGPLPHVTIQCPVYKEGLEGVIMPTVESLEAAIADYQSHGGTVNMFFNDDGMQLISEKERVKRKQYYKDHGIGWVARPKHNPEGKGETPKFVRRGKFKKASNMNFALAISIKVEEKLIEVDREGVWTQDEEEIAYENCLKEVLEETNGIAWAGGDIRVGDYVLIIDSDTRVPVNCMINAVSELEESPQVAILQFSSGVMNVTTSFFENGITFFTNLIYTAIRYAVAAGDVSPFVGHNSFLRWSALQETSFVDTDDPEGQMTYEKFWSESHVSEDFDIALRLQTQGYLVRLAAYCGDEFKEGVSLTVYDELARWEKYAYGCNELLFHPIKFWWRRGPFTPLFIRFITSNMPLPSKFTILAYIGTYYAIGYAWIASIMNYFLIGWLNGHLDHFYMSSWNVWVALIVVFSGVGNLALAVVRYRGEDENLTKQLWICFRWVPLLFVFLGGISMHVSQALLSHMFSVDMTWGATAKELEDTSFFIELPIIAKRFKFVFLFCILVVGLIISGVVAFPALWRIDQMVAIFPLATIVFSHFFLPVLLNPALMKFTW